MEDHAEAAGCGGGKGGRDREDASASPKELALLWTQRNKEARALRSEYAGVRAMIRDGGEDRWILLCIGFFFSNLGIPNFKILAPPLVCMTAEVKDDPTLGRFDAALNKIEKLHEKVQRPMEQVADAQALLDLSNALVSSTKVENRDGPTPSELITALISKFGAKASPLGDSDALFNWSSLGCAVSGLFMTAAGCQTMNGHMDLGVTVKERRRAVRRQSGHLGSEPAKPDELAPDQDEMNDTDENIAVMFNLLRSHTNGNVKLEHLILNRESFAQTVENLFALSFLVKDGRAEIYVADNGSHYIAPRNAPSAASIASRDVVNSQFVFRFDFKDWQVMKGMVSPGEELMPHRSSYHGGEYKTTQSLSAPDCSMLASDSEHAEQGRFHKEDPEELDLVNCCSGFGGLELKKRKRQLKRQYVARRRLFD